MDSTASALSIKRGSRLFVELACGEDDVRESQALRFNVFGEEMGATLEGDDFLLPHLARLVRHPDLRVQIRFLAPLDGSALTRRQISEHCHSAIAKALGCETSSPRPPIPLRAAAELHVSPPTPFVEAA